MTAAGEDESMKHVALILAGGSGQRMQQNVPKQFLHINEKPLLIYTLEAFQRHPEIEKILVVCIDGWHEMLRAYARQFQIDKLEWIISGGGTSQESIRNGVFFLERICGEEDIVVIHDGIRPLVEESVLTDVLKTCREHGNAVTSMPYNEQIFVKENEECTRQYIPRDTLRRVSTPQAYRFGKLAWGYRKAFAEGIGTGPSSYANTMMVDLGEQLYFAKGSDKNIKITTQDDLAILKALLYRKG